MSNSQEKEKILDSINYLDWYFGEDDGGADKDAVKAYDVLRTTVFRLYRKCDGFEAGVKSAMPRWIPVTERLPENRKYVLAYSADDDYTAVEERRMFEVFQITHWMPLPELPKEED